MKKLNNKGFGIVPVLLTVLVITAIVGVGWYVYKSQDKSTSSSSTESTTVNVKELQDKLLDANNEVQKLKTDLAAATISEGAISPQCEDGNDKAVFGRINKEAASGYIFYTVDCKDNLAANDPKPKLIAVKVKGDNSVEFAYGASSGEPLCISKDAIDNALEVSKTLGFPVCKY